MTSKRIYPGGKNSHRFLDQFQVYLRNLPNHTNPAFSIFSVLRFYVLIVFFRIVLIPNRWLHCNEIKSDLEVRNGPGKQSITPCCHMDQFTVWNRQITVSFVSSLLGHFGFSKRWKQSFKTKYICNYSCQQNWQTVSWGNNKYKARHL